MQNSDWENSIIELLRDANLWSQVKVVRVEQIWDLKQPHG
jgi:hypothetical protein